MFCNKNYQHKFHQKLKEQFFITYKNKFILLLRKSVYPDECMNIWMMDNWKKFNERSLPGKKKKDFYSHLNMKDITDADYAHAKRVCKDFELKNLGEYHDLYGHDTLLIADVFRTLEICVLKSMNLIPQNFFQLLD